MKITIIATSGFYPVHIGGPASVGYFLAKEFGESGHHVTVFVRVKNVKETSLAQKLPESAGLVNVNIFPILIDYNLKTIINFPSLLSKIFRTSYKFLKINSDVVLYNSPPVDVMLLIPLISKILSIDQYFILHGGLFNESKNYIGRYLIKCQRNFFKKTIAISSYSKDIATKTGFDQNKIAIINNGVDLVKYDYLTKSDIMGDPSLLYIGRLEKIKGVDVLIKAFKTVQEKLPNSHLYIVGEGSEKVNYIKLCHNLGIDFYVSFIGYVPPSDKLYQYYKDCDILILPSYVENFPITLLEAMYFKIPIIATSIPGGVTEIIKNRINGLLVEPGNSEGLAERIIELQSDKKAQNTFTKYNYSLVCKEYTWNHIAKKYLSLFKKADQDKLKN